MNPLLQEAATSVEMGWLLGVTTVAFLLFFLGWTWWAYSPGNKARMEADSLIPLMDGDES